MYNVHKSLVSFRCQTTLGPVTLLLHEASANHEPTSFSGRFSSFWWLVGGLKYGTTYCRLFERKYMHLQRAWSGIKTNMLNSYKFPSVQY